MILLFKYAWKEVKRRKKRSISTLFGYAIAIAAIIILVSFIIYANKLEEEVLYDLGTRLIAFIPSTQEHLKSHEGFVAFTTYTELMEQDIFSKISISELIDDVSPFISFKMENQLNGISYITIGGFDTSNKKAVYKNYCSPDDILKGRFIKSGERDVIMVGEAYANSAHLDVGDSLMIQDKSFTVIGIVNTEMEPIKSDVYMNIEDASNVIAERTGQSLIGKFNCLFISVTDARFQEKAIAKVKSILGSSAILTTSSCFRPSIKAMVANTSHMYLMFIIILISTVLFSIKIQHGSVVERYHDIGILKAIGWTDRDILEMIFLESTIQSVLGGIIGCIIGIILILIVPFGQWIDSALDTVYALISWEALLLGLAVAIICGSLTALVSGLTISHKEPATILKKI